MLFEAENIRFSYGSAPVLDGLSVGFEAGRFHGILGPNGSGKTTFLDLLVRHLSPDSGTIRFMDRDLGGFSRKELALRIALVAQNPVIHFPYRVRDLVMMGRHPYIGRFSSPAGGDWDVVGRVMEQTDVSHYADAAITELSGGERQRVLFARALAQETPVLILDEATSNLDIRHSLDVLNLARDGVENHGKTVIAVFQDINLASLFCDRMVFMKKGGVHAAGDTADMMDSGLIGQVYGVASRVIDSDYSEAKQVVFNRTGRMALQ
jgi:iron complex transport system ATP-binding protein